MNYYSVVKRNELPSYETTWRNLIYVLLSERRQSEKAACCNYSNSMTSGKGKTIDIVKWSAVAEVCFEEEGMNWQSTGIFRE